MKYYEVDFEIRTSLPEAVVQDVRDLIAAGAGEAGFETFEETETGITGYVQTGMFCEDSLKAAIGDIAIDGVDIIYNVRDAEYKDWNEQWENEGFAPIVVDGKCAIHDGRHLPEGQFDISVEIDARMAFGTGTHETTRMMVASLLGMNLEGKTVLDCGCGTGILGIAALKGGAAGATGYDIDEWSADNSRHNAVINSVDSRYEALQGDASVIDGLGRKFDIVLANINRNILLNDMPRFREAMKEGGVLILSGFYKEDAGMLTERAASLGMKPCGERSDGNWACLTFR